MALVVSLETIAEPKRGLGLAMVLAKKIVAVADHRRERRGEAPSA